MLHIYVSAIIFQLHYFYFTVSLLQTTMSKEVKRTNIVAIKTKRQM